MLRAVMFFALVSIPAIASAQHASEPQEDHRVVFAAGWAGEASRGEGFQPAGIEGGFEVTPIEGLLSIETTVSVHHGDDGTEVPIEVAFRKPWQVTPTVEFMAGVAPSLVHAFGAESETFGAVSAGGHFMVWPRPNVGWYVESAYEVAFPNRGTQHSVEFAAGILIGR